MVKRLLFATILVLILMALPGISARAQVDEPGDVTDDEVNTIAEQLYCPVCENIPLDVCPTQACEEWRQDIREKLIEGWTEDQIKEYFVNRYGDRVLAAPPARGLNWLVYLVPPIVIILGGIFLFRTMNQWRDKPEKLNTTGEQITKEGIPNSSQEGQSSQDDRYIKQMEEALRNQKS